MSSSTQKRLYFLSNGEFIYGIELSSSETTYLSEAKLEVELDKCDTILSAGKFVLPFILHIALVFHVFKYHLSASSMYIKILTDL